ncbi:hypothetical protein NMG60_11017659 [Bertholletia excelsa]
MSSKNPPLRPLGQRSIPSTFLFRSSKHRESADGQGDAKNKSPIKDSRVSLSEFLSRKLHKGSALPCSVQRKDRPFLSPLGNDASRSKEMQNEVKERGEPVLDLVLEQFKCTKKENEDCHGSVNVDVVQTFTSLDDVRVSAGGKEPFAGEDGKPVRKRLVVLGEDLKTTRPIPKKRGMEQSVTASKKPLNHFNHYGNGSGWWDCNMEGVDNEEVGCSEIWEGVGSTTLGGLEWH